MKSRPASHHPRGRTSRPFYRAIRVAAIESGIFATVGALVGVGGVARELKVNYPKAATLFRYLVSYGVLVYLPSTGLYRVARPMVEADVWPTYVRGGARVASTSPLRHPEPTCPSVPDPEPSPTP